ncbi:MAG: ATP-binding protein [Pseudomonadaceae bacterium]|nr:ATP-binding protein [Pseudomonadaceae bacterium]
MHKPAHLSRQLSRLYGGFIVLLIFMAGIGFLAGLYIVEREAIEDEATLIATLIGTETRGSLIFADRQLLARHLDSLNALDDIIGGCLHSADGELLASVGPHTCEIVELNDGDLIDTPTITKGLRASRDIRWRDKTLGTLTLVRDPNAIWWALARTSMPFLALLVLLTLVSLWSIRYLSKRATRPIQNLVGEIKELDVLSGQRLTANDNAEIVAIANAFNTTIDEVSSARHAAEDEIARRKGAQRSEREARALLSNIVDTVPYLIFAIERDGSVRFANRTAATAYGTDIEKIISGEFASQYDGLRPDNLLFSGNRAQDDAIDQNIWFTDSQGDSRRFSVARMPLSSIDAELVIAVDITEEHRLQMQLQFAQRLELVGTLAGGLAHDFNNLLTPILGYASILADRTDFDPDTHKKLTDIETAALRARDIVQQVLTFSSPREDNPSADVDLQLITSEAIDLLNASLPGNVTMTTHMHGRISPVVGSEGQIEQVLVNLLSNAVQALPERGGEITITLATQRRDLVGQPANRKYSSITVRDTGSGISSDMLPHIFDPFFTTKAVGKGTGLGLAVALGIVRKHGGDIIVDSEVGRGSSFTVCLPVSTDLTPTVEMPALATGSDLDATSETVLLVDDDEPVLAVTSELLRREGYTVVPFSTPSLALDTLLAAPDKFDLVLTDNAMPLMSGLELAANIREASLEIPIVVITGFVDLEVDHSHIDSCIMKPISGSDLSHALQSALHARASV